MSFTSGWSFVALLAVLGCTQAAPSQRRGSEGEEGGEGAVASAADLAVVDLAGQRGLGTALPTATTCATCHANTASSDSLRDSAGRPVAPFDLWQSSMMANAARDPLFRAQLAAEVKRAPAAAAAIEATCLSCHAPLLTRARAAADAPTVRLRDLNDNDDDAIRGLDGVSCATCHRAAADGLGEEASFDGQYALGPDDVIFGPYQAPFTQPMLNHTGLTPTFGSHINSAAMCGSCHTLVTHALRPDGTNTGVAFDEQTPFLEYRASAYPAEGATCQSCHMPRTDVDGAAIDTVIAHRPDGRAFPPVGSRTPFGRHVLVGGNTLIPQLLRNESALGATAPAAAFDATIAAATLLLRSAATVAIGDAVDASGQVQIPIVIRSTTGHKLPSGYPARRLVVHVRVLGEDGVVLLESGRLDAAGRVIDGNGTPLPSEVPGGAITPHLDVISSAATALIYETVPADHAGLPTTSLLAAERTLKDNRLLPRGYLAASVDGQRVAPIGVVDDNFGGDGADTVTVSVSGRPVRVEVELLYQTLAPRWRQGIVDSDTPWGKALDGMLDRADTAAVTVASASRDL